MTKYYVVMSKKENVATIYFNFQKSVPPIRFRVCTHIQIAPSKWQTVNKSITAWNKFAKSEEGKPVVEKLELMQQAISDLYAQGKIRSNADKHLAEEAVLDIVNAEAKRKEEENARKRAETARQRKIDEEDAKNHYYLRIKTGEELWNGLPILLRMGIQMFLQKSAKELGEHFKRTITAFVLNAGDMYESMQERMKEDADNNLLHCVLYYISMGGGLVRSAKHLSSLLHSTKGISQMMMFVPSVIGKMTEVSIKHGHDKQSDWKELTNYEDNEVSKEVKHALVDTKGIRGRRVINTTKFNLDDMLIGNKEKIKEQIRRFRKTYKCTTHLSFLLIMLVRAECVDKWISYPHFHHAMEELEGKKYDMDRVSRMYNYMFYHKEEFEKSELPKWCNGRMITRNWQKSFEKCSRLS